MPRNGSGAYSLPAGNPVVTGTTISSTVHNATMSDIATALTNSLSKDGQTVPTANLPMGGFKHTGADDGSAPGDYTTIGQLAASSGASLIGFIQSGTGAVLRELQDKGRETVTPADFSGGDDTAKILAAIATGKSIDLGGVENTYTINASLGTLASGQWLVGKGAKIVTSADAPVISHGDGSGVVGIVFQGSGKDSGKTSQVGVKLLGNGSYVGPTRSTTAFCRFIDMGGAGYQVGNVVENHQGNIAMGLIYESCNIGLDLGERGEYTQVIGGSATLCNTGVRVCGGNSNLGGMTICDNTIGLLIDAGSNDAHGQVTGCSINHNTYNVKANAINTTSFAINGGSVYAGTVWLNHCTGVRFVGTDFGTTTIHEEGALDCYFQGCKFSDDPTIVPNYNGTQSDVYYLDCIWPLTLSATSSKRINGAYSEVKQVNPYPTIATATTHNYGFNSVVVNAISANTSYAVNNLYDTTNKCWDFNELTTPKGDFFATVAVNLTIGKLGGAFDDTTVDVYIYDTVDGVRLATLTKGPDINDAGSHFRIYSFMGRVPKANGKIGIRIRNDTGGDIVVANHTSSSPTYGWATGW